MSIAELRNLIETEELSLRAWLSHHSTYVAQWEGMIRQRQVNVIAKAKALPGRIDVALAQASAKIQQEVESLLAHYPPYLGGDWDQRRWADFVPDQVLQPGFLPIGTLEENGGLRFPFFVPFIGRRRTLVFQGSGENEGRAFAVMQSTLMRIALMLPYQATFTLLGSPVQTSPLAKPLGKWLRRNSGDTAETLAEILADVSRINRLHGCNGSFETLPVEVRSQERFEFILVSRFPRGFGSKEIELLEQLSADGPRAGRYLLVHFNPTAPLPPGARMPNLRKVQVIDVDQITRQTGTFRLTLSTLPPAPIQSAILRNLSLVKPPENHFRFNDIAMPDPTDWWTHATDQRVEAVVGLTRSRDPLRLWFGVAPDGRPCAHGMLGAMTGSGKSNLYHVLICSLALRYGPSELALYLIDGKDGVEFQDYRNLPHARAVVLNSTAEMSRSVLAELVEEKERRNEIFAQSGVTNLADYRKAGQPKGKLPRIIVMIDEFQELFEEDRDGVASRHLLVLSQQGRSAGIHLVLGSQRFGVVGMLHQAAILGNIHLRLAMKMSHSDVQSLTEFGREGKQLIASCKVPGMMVANDQSGDDQANSVGKVAFLSPAQRRELVADLAGKAARECPGHAQTMVFDGRTQPELLQTPAFRHLLSLKTRPSEAGWEDLAQTPLRMGGFEEPDWYAAERPHVLWLGREYTMHGQARAVVRRRPLEHVLIAGGSHSARYAMMSAAVTGLAMAPSPAQVTVLDQSIPKTPWHDALENTCRLVFAPAGISHTFGRTPQDAESAIERLVQELDRRLALSAAQCHGLPSWFLVIADTERIQELTRVVDRFKAPADSPLGGKLRRLYSEGSSVGIHLILGFALVAPMSKLLDRSALDQFRHRIALQMSEEDALAFVQSRKAALLQAYGPRPISALYKDMTSDTLVRFKPYVCDGPVRLVDELSQAGNQIKRWRQS